LVVFGVAGELVAEGLVSRADGTLQTFNDILLSEAQKESAFAIERASNAYERAATAERETEKLRKQVAWRHLSAQQQADFINHMKPFRGQQYVLYTASAVDPEIEDFASSSLRAALGEDSDGAGWKLVTTGDTSLPITGVEVQVLKSANARSRTAASALVSWLNSNGIKAVMKAISRDKAYWWVAAFNPPNSANPETGIAIAVGKRL
jgi:hypothetical protein